LSFSPETCLFFWVYVEEHLLRWVCWCVHGSIWRVCQQLLRVYSEEGLCGEALRVGWGGDQVPKLWWHGFRKWLWSIYFMLLVREKWKYSCCTVCRQGIKYYYLQITMIPFIINSIILFMRKYNGEWYNGEWYNVV
jgi:hypothetical protein